MKINHNKKRNTLFLYESLVREYTKAKLDNDPRKLQEISNLFVEYFFLKHFIKCLIVIIADT